MYATINELSQEYIVLVRDDGFQRGRNDARQRRKRDVLDIFLPEAKEMPFVRELLRNKAVMSADGRRASRKINRLAPSAIPEWRPAKNPDR